MFAGNPRWTETKGQTLPLIVVFMLLLMVVCGMVLDIGNAYRVKTALQASADAAAAAGAGQLPNTGSALSTVQQYGSETGGKNPVRGSGNVTISGVANCVTSAKFCSPANTVPRDREHQRPDRVPACHRHRHDPDDGALPGLLAVRRKAAGRDGRARPHGVDVGHQAPSAKDGIQAFLGSMDTGLDNVGLAVLPPAANTGSACAASSSNYNSVNAAYVRGAARRTPMRSIDNGNIGSTTTRRCCRRSAAFRPAADRVCHRARRGPGGDSTPTARAGIQKVIIILSDGAANTGPELPQRQPRPTGPSVRSGGQQCRRGVRPAKVLMYSIAYDISGRAPARATRPRGQSSTATRKSSNTPSAGDPVERGAAADRKPRQLLRPAQPTQLTTIFLAISADLAGGTAESTAEPGTRAVNLGAPAVFSRAPKWCKYAGAGPPECGRA